MSDEPVGVYLDVALGRYVAREWTGPDGLVTLADTKARAERLAESFNKDLEEDFEMAKAKKKSAKVAKVKGEKKARAPKAPKVAKERERDPRIPAAGTIIKKEYGGETHEVRINEADFTYRGDRYKTLSAVAHVITEKKHAHGISGFIFFKEQLAAKVDAA